MNPHISRLRDKFLRELDRLPRQQSFAVVGEMLVFVCLDGQTSVEEFENVLDLMRSLYARCKDDSDDERLPS